MYKFLKESTFRFIYTLLPSQLPSRKLTTRSDLGISMLLCHNDVEMAIYCLQTLFYQLGEALPVYVIDDGSLSTVDKSTLKNMFNMTIEDTSSALTKMEKQYKTYKHFMAYLSGMDVHVKRFKLAALFLSPFRKSILLEPDILFLKYPKEIAEFSNSEKNFFQIFSVDAYNWLAKKNYHWDFSMRKFYYSKLKLNVDLLFNGGLMLVNRKTINDKLAKRIDEFLKLCEVTEYEKSVFAEETLLSSVFTKDASVLLPPRQYVTLLQYFEYHDMKKNGGESNLISLHISSNVRPLFIYQAVKLSIQSGLFRLKRQASTN